jgi:glycosyltransferase involved in cell wall biosynthesis
MRIAQMAPLAESVPPKLYGGTERVVAWLVDELVSLGHEVTLFASGDSQTSARLHAVWPQALRLGRPRTDPMVAQAALLEAVARHATEFDVIHAHNPPDTLFVVALAHKLFGKQYIFDHHDLCPELYCSRYSVRRDFVARVLQAIEWFNLKLANVTIAANESYKQFHIERGGRKPGSIFVVRNGPNRK